MFVAIAASTISGVVAERLKFLDIDLFNDFFV